MLNQISSFFQKASSYLSPEGLTLGIIAGLSLSSPAWGLTIAPSPTVPIRFSQSVADFDSLERGFFGPTIIDDGITFSNLIAGFRQTFPEFVVQSSNRFEPVFSAPNYLTFGLEPNRRGRPPRSAPFGVLGSLTITPEQASQFVTIDVLAPNPDLALAENPFFFDQELVLSAFLDGELVGSDSVFLSEFETFNRSGRVVSTTLSISDLEFDQLQLFTPSFAADGVISVGIDNITITSISPFPPEPFPLPITPIDPPFTPPILLPVPIEPVLSASFINTIETSEIAPLETVPESQPMTIFGLIGVGLLGYLTKNKCVTKI
ncbi:MAG: hypothetical protein QNJ64_06630 [Crocosphaera sp.]|nr:hypothetical protein [Crocosphaera sp.]